MISYRKITIIQSRKPAKPSINQKLQYLANSLGLFNLRDKENSCFRLFIELIKSAKRNEELSSDELAARLGLTRGTIVHHLNKLIESGLVIVEKNKYYLRVSNLKELINEVEKDMARTLEDLKGIASEVDEQLGL
ncbi:winged helix-turn-helix transcriptional regulator [Candidatus Woesearchaeota archaeon]|nr:winged helix-turn-helix transcriptional regulator [Candidatus Woesearchaeota archaeon]